MIKTLPLVLLVIATGPRAGACTVYRGAIGAKAKVAACIDVLDGKAFGRYFYERVGDRLPLADL